MTEGGAGVMLVKVGQEMYWGWWWGSWDKWVWGYRGSGMDLESVGSSGHFGTREM